MGFDWFDIMRPCRIRIWRVPSWHPWAFFRNLWFIWYSEALFHLNVKNQYPSIFANIAGIISIRVSNPRFPDMENAMDTLFWWSNIWIMLQHQLRIVTRHWSLVIVKDNLNKFFAINMCIVVYILCQQANPYNVCFYICALCISTVHL